MNAEVSILTMKWGTLYSSEDVNRLYRQVRRNLSRPHRFICFTDDAEGLAPGIEALDLPKLKLPEDNHDTRWRKLVLFRRDLGGLCGTALFLDLDLVIVDDIGPFFEYPGIVPIIRDDDLFRPKPLRRFTPKRDQFMHMVGNTSVFRFEIGAHSDILESYQNAADLMAGRYEHEQQMVSDLLDRQKKLSYWPRGWCVSFKNDCVGRGLRSYLFDPVCPSNAKVVLFAGSPKMADVLAGTGGKWYRHIGNIEWLQQAWMGE